MIQIEHSAVWACDRIQLRLIVVSFNFVPGKYSECLLTGNQLKVAPCMSPSLSHPNLWDAAMYHALYSYTSCQPGSEFRRNTFGKKKLSKYS